MYVCLCCLQVWICVCLWVSLTCSQVGLSWWVSRQFACVCCFYVCVWESVWESLRAACLFLTRCSLLHLLQCWALARAGTGRGRSGVERAGFPPTAWRKWCTAAKITDQVITAHVHMHTQAFKLLICQSLSKRAAHCCSWIRVYYCVITFRNLDSVFQRAVVNEPNASSAITPLGPTTALTLPGKTSLSASRHWC